MWGATRENDRRKARTGCVCVWGVRAVQVLWQVFRTVVLHNTFWSVSLCACVCVYVCVCVCVCVCVWD